MKTLMMSRTLSLASLMTLTAAAILQTPTTFAGVGAGGGGDAATEMRIDEIRADILKWISQGGASSLRLPDRISMRAYLESMSKVLQPHAVVIGGVTAAEERASFDPELKVVVDGQPKTCRGFISSRDRLPHIICNIERFAATSSEQQYRLIHHEFAGLAGIENNISASSDYTISGQITEFLVQETVLRLAVKKPDTRSAKGIDDFVGTYTLASERHRGNQICPEKLTISAGKVNELWINSQSVRLGKSSETYGENGDYRCPNDGCILVNKYNAIFRDGVLTTQKESYDQPAGDPLAFLSRNIFGTKNHKRVETFHYRFYLDGLALNGVFNSDQGEENYACFYRATLTNSSR